MVLRLWCTALLALLGFITVIRAVPAQNSTREPDHASEVHILRPQTGRQEQQQQRNQQRNQARPPGDRNSSRNHRYTHRYDHNPRHDNSTSRKKSSPQGKSTTADLANKHFLQYINAPNQTAHFRTVSHACQLKDKTRKSRPFKVVIYHEIVQHTMFLNWLIFFTQVCGLKPLQSQLYIVCADSKSVTLLHDIHLNCSSIIQKPRSERLMKAAWMLIKGQRVDVLMTSTEAIWLRNPLPHIEFTLNQYDADIISSRGSWPSSIASKWGATLCLGFTYFKATKFTENLLKQAVKGLQQDLPKSTVEVEDTHAAANSEQTALNQLIFKKEIVWNQNKYKKLLFEGSVATDVAVSVSTPKGIIALLPHNKFVRKCLTFPLFGDKQEQAENKQQVNMLINSSFVMNCLPTANIRQELFLSYINLWKLPYLI